MPGLVPNRREAPVTLTVIRHVPARPGQKALFPVLGNGTISRFKVDAALSDGEWRWEGALPASDSQFDVFAGTAELDGDAEPVAQQNLLFVRH